MKFLIIVVLSLINMLYASNSLSSETISEDLEPMFKLMRFTSFRDPPMTKEMMIQESLAIVLGKIVSVTEGREIYYNPKRKTPLKTSLMKVEVSKVIKGDVGKHVYIEHISAGLPAKALNERKYTGETLFFLAGPGWNEVAFLQTKITWSKKLKLKLPVSLFVFLFS